MKHRDWLIVPDAIPVLAAGLILLLVLAFFFGPWGAVVPGIFVLFTLFFFRNPPRSAQADPQDVLSPADGVVLFIEEVEENRFLHAPATKVSIFLNVFNVHVNRAPIAGKVEYVSYQPGKFLPAFKGHASTLNERNYLGLRSEQNPAWALLVVQITGFVARRIVCWMKEGDRLVQGERFGLIKFGSCTEVYLPRDAQILVRTGQKVRGGETVIGRLQP